MLKKLLLAASVLCVLFFMVYSVKKSTVITHGFASYYTISRILLEGDSPGMAYDTTYFNMKMRQYGIENIHDIITGAPTSFLVLLPFSGFSPVAAKMAWTALSVFCFFFAIYILLLIFDIPNNSITGLAAIITAFLFYPAYYNIALGQNYIFLLLLFSLSLYGVKKESLWLTAVPLGIIIAVKGYGFIPLFILLLCRRWKEAALSAGVVIAIVLLTLPLIHIQTWRDYFGILLTGFGRDEFSGNVSYQTVNGFLRHLLSFDPVYNPNSLLALNSGQVNLIVILISLVILSIFVFRRQKESAVNLFTAAIALNVVLAPLAEEYHYVFLLPLIFLIGSNIAPIIGKHKISAAVFFVSVILMAAPLNYKMLQGSVFPVFLLAYPKLFFAIVLLLMFRFISLADRNITKN